MAEKSKLEDMGSDYCEFDEKGTQKISVSDQSNAMNFSNSQPGSFVIDMGGLSSQPRATPNSRITLQRSFSRKTSSNQRSGEKKTGPASDGKEEDNGVISSSSPRGKISAPIKTNGTITSGMMKDQTMNPQSNHHITIVTSNGSSNTTNDKRLAFRRSSIWAIDPRKILLVLATLSSMGTILLIYLTLSIRKLGVDDSSLE